MYSQVEGTKKEQYEAAYTNSPRQKRSVGQDSHQDLRTQAFQLHKLQEVANQYTSKNVVQRQTTANKTGLPHKLKQGIEQLSGYSMDNVRVHYNSTKPAQLQAHAYAKGNDIHVAPGEERHLPHEAWHVVQQKQGRVKPIFQMKKGISINDDPGLENEADTMGRKALQMRVQVPFTKVLSTSPHSVVQRAKLNIRKKDNTISGVSNFPSRPSSNLRGSQGQHLTAYVVFEDTILSKVKDKTVPGAAAALIGYLEEIKTLPGMALKSADYLKPHIASTIDTLKEHSDNAKVVGDQIDMILSIRNKVPGTAQHGTGGGHGEAGHSGILETVETALRTKSWNPEWDDETVANQCRASVWRLLDYDPPNPGSDEALETVINNVLTHFKSVISAYPKVEHWLGSNGYFFVTYLEEHRDAEGMPLQRLKKEQFDAVFEQVHGRL